MKPNQLKVWTGFACAAAIALSAVIAAPASAEIITVTVDSASFDLAYGATGAPAAPPTWNTSETSGTNTATTLGSFSFTPAVVGAPNAPPGVTFANRVLADGPLNTEVQSYSDSFSLTIVGSFDDALPSYATNPRITLKISELSIWAVQAYDPGTTAQFAETTVGHTSNSSSVALVDTRSGTGNGTTGTVAEHYRQLVWNPADFEVNGTTSTRTFNLPGARYSMDGLIIKGEISLSYEAPEPASAALLTIGSIGVLARRRKA